jgi:hypothetical protein
MRQQAPRQKWTRRLFRGSTLPYSSCFTRFHTGSRQQFFHAARDSIHIASRF